MRVFCTPYLHRGYLGLPLRGAPRQGSAAHNFCFLMNAPKFLSFCPEPSRGARTDMGLGVGVLAASRNVLHRFIVIWIMPLRMSSALRMILGAPMPGRKVSRTNMGLGVNEVFAASLDDLYRVFGNAPMPGRKVSRTNMGLGCGSAPMPGRKVSWLPYNIRTHDDDVFGRMPVDDDDESGRMPVDDEPDGTDMPMDCTTDKTDDVPGNRPVDNATDVLGMSVDSSWDESEPSKFSMSASHV